ncbi:spore germination protein [Bacillus sp. HMF5848]|uniref:spore germination protein n=1 Tax=Bacillus sp. HMF5848 TaxID=2495421 RepID=UPI000F7806F6|nr:spore germination protein [Bacillus sp. HMF5848]RSK26610.1 spore germination protein [Bacillus sp. HMF5848]
MPTIILGPVNIREAGGVVVFGDTFYISPKDTAKTLAGSGAINTGSLVITNNGFSTLNNADPDTIDQPTTTVV